MELFKWFIRVVLVLLVIAILLYLRSYQSFSNRLQANDEKTYKSRKASRKALIIFQDSKHGTVERYVGIIKDILVSSEYSVTVNHPRPDLSYDPMKYDLIVLACAAYLGKPSSRIVEYITKNPFINRKILVLMTGIDPDDSRELKQIEEVIPNHNSVSTLKVGKNDDELVKKMIRKMI